MSGSIPVVTADEEQISSLICTVKAISPHLVLLTKRILQNGSENEVANPITGRNSAQKSYRRRRSIHLGETHG